MTKLDVLDLHGNQIEKVENLGHLEELRVLNLAGNNITHVNNMAGMEALAELNLRRNKIITVVSQESSITLICRVRKWQTNNIYCFSFA